MASRTSPFLFLQFHYQTAAFICKPPNNFVAMNVSVNSAYLSFIWYLSCKNSGNTVCSHDRKCLILHCYRVKRKRWCLSSPKAVALIPAALLHPCGSLARHGPLCKRRRLEARCSRGDRTDLAAFWFNTRSPARYTLSTAPASPCEATPGKRITSFCPSAKQRQHFPTRRAVRKNRN